MAPWPLRVVPHFIATVTLPLALLAIALGAFADAELASPGFYPLLRVDVAISTAGTVPIAIRPEHALFELRERRATEILVEVTNMSPDQRVTLSLVPDNWPAEFGARLEAYGSLAPGETRSVRLQVSRRSVLYGGEFTGSLVILAEPVP
jgi:hypothetical protein